MRAREVVTEPDASFEAAVAITSLHHVEPLDDSLRRLAAQLGHLTQVLSQLPH